MALESSSAPGAHHDSSSHDGAPFDDRGVHYPVSDNMGDSGLQITINVTLWLLLRDYFKRLGRPVLTGIDQFFYYKRGDASAVVAPDVYVIDDETEPLSSIKSWKVWEHGGKAPTLAVEVVSDDSRKDYDDELLLSRYQQLGVRELVRYDPMHVGPRRRLFTHYVRNLEGRLVPHPTAKDRVRCASYDFWLVKQPDLSLRLGMGPDGSALWPTKEEQAAAEATRAEAEATRADAEATRAEAEAERAAAEAERAEAAEAELGRLRAELARLRGE